MQLISFENLVRRYFSGEGFVLFDTETSGLNTYHDDIIEIGAMIWQKGTEPHAPAGTREPKTFQKIMNVNINKISEGAWKIHKIPREEIEAAPGPSQVLSEFLEFCGGRTLIAHNIRFDYDILNNNLIRNGLKPYQNDQVACTLAYAKEKGIPGKLVNLAAHYEVKTEAESLHRALYDVQVLKDVLDHMMKAHEPAEMQYSLIL